MPDEDVAIHEAQFNGAPLWCQVIFKWLHINSTVLVSMTDTILSWRKSAEFASPWLLVPIARARSTIVPQRQADAIPSEGLLTPFSS
jgi:hypothetical protein